MSKILAIPVNEKNKYERTFKGNISGFRLYEIKPFSSKFLKLIDVSSKSTPQEKFIALMENADYILISDIDEVEALSLEKKGGFEFVIVNVNGAPDILAAAFANSYSKIIGDDEQVESLYPPDYKKNPLGDRIIASLKDVIDIEVGKNVWDFGLIRDFYADEEGNVKFTFIPTSPVCPLAFKLGRDIKNAIKKAGGKIIQIKVVNYYDIPKLESYLNDI